MRRLGLTIALLALATPAAAQYYGNYGSGRVTTARPDNGSPTSRAGSYTNPYIVQDQQGRRMGTITESRPSQPGGAQGGSYSNPYVYQPNRYR